MIGMDLARRVGLKLGRCKKFSETRGTFVAWQVQNIVWGKFDGDKLLLKDDASPNFDDWLECRVFNRREEFHIKRAGEKFVGRYVRDDGDQKFYGLMTRNHIGSDAATGLSGYVDYRFVAIESAWDGD